MHECEEAICEEQLTTHLQHMEKWLNRFGDQFEWFGDQIGAQLEALTKQFATMSGANKRFHQPNPRFVEEDYKFIVKEVWFNKMR
jgi:primosomal protein N''